MPRQAMSSAEWRPQAGGYEEPPAKSGTWHTLGRHQMGSAVASAIDFCAMILCVEALRLSPVLGTAVGATLGAATNFGLVSAASAGWNSLGEHVMHDRAHLQYVLARALVALAVSLLWNFPLQRRFVFRERSLP